MTSGPGVHQFVPTFEPGAVGSHMLQVRRVVREMGLPSTIFAEHRRWPGRTDAEEYRRYGRAVPAQPGDVLLYQTAIGSTVADFVLARPETLAVNYHNITPVRYFADWEPGVVHGVAWGRAQLAAMGERAALGIAVSRYNERELSGLGYRRTTVVPVLVDLDAFDVEVDPGAEERLASPASTWLFVGRVAPNKAHHDLIKAFAAYRRAYDPDAVLRIVGAPSSADYSQALRSFVEALGLTDAVVFAGPVSEALLAAHYRAADVFVCVSDHEGFCVPLLEAMHHRLPVVAYASSAVPETLGDAGLLLEGKAATTVAAAVHRVLVDGDLRAGLVAAGGRRLADFSLARTGERMAEALGGLLAGTGSE